MASPAPAASLPRLFAGTSGWAYPTWKPGFYPEGVSAKKFLSFYASQLNSVEVNYTFTTLPTPEIVESWLAQTPANFRFSFKAPQRITHFSRLLDCQEHLADFLACLVPVAQAGKLGLILFQTPPNFKPDTPRLEKFLKLPALSSPEAPPIAFEFRHPGWFADETYAVLKRHNAALCIAETEALQTPEVHTATTHTCFRLRRTGGYKPRHIRDFVERFAALAQASDQSGGQPRDVYAYFRHEDEPTGALNAAAFLKAARKGFA